MPRSINLVPTIPKIIRKKRVAAYARVSTEKDAMLHSLSSQVSYYNELIQSNPEWEYAGVYADESKTGTKDSRAEFQRLIADCHAGKIDMVITKSISRFARNTVTLLQTVRDFKSWGVDIYFEEQNIHTMSANGELMLTILASYAQKESRSASENQKWRIKHNFEEGLPWNGALLGYRLKDGRFDIIPEEAELVRRIFREYLSGDGYHVIARRLNDEGIPSRFGGKLDQRVISKILANYTYTGNLLLQKTFRENHITKKKLMNTGELPMYHVEEAHEAIIDMDTFRAVQEEKARRSTKFTKKRKKPHLFTSLLVCDVCGKNYRRKVTRGSTMWVCRTYDSAGKAFCDSKQIPEDILLEVTADVLGQSDFTEETLRSQIKSILICKGNTLIFRFHDGKEVTRKWSDRSRSRSWTDEMKEAVRQRELERRKHLA